MIKKLFAATLLVFPQAHAMTEQGVFGTGMIVIHTLEVLLGIYICVLALRLSSIIKPIDIFVYLYLTVGFAILNTLVEIIPHLFNVVPTEPIHIVSRILFLGALISLACFFWRWNRAMRGSAKVEIF